MSSRLCPLEHWTPVHSAGFIIILYFSFIEWLQFNRILSVCNSKLISFTERQVSLEMDESEDYVDLLVGSDEEDDFDLDGHEAPAPMKTAKAVPTMLVTAAVALPPVSHHQEDAEMADEDGEIATTPPQPNGRSSAKLSEEDIEDLYHRYSTFNFGEPIHPVLVCCLCSE